MIRSYVNVDRNCVRTLLQSQDEPSPPVSLSEKKNGECLRGAGGHVTTALQSTAGPLLRGHPDDHTRGGRSIRERIRPVKEDCECE